MRYGYPAQSAEEVLDQRGLADTRFAYTPDELARTGTRSVPRVA